MTKIFSRRQSNKLRHELRNNCLMPERILWKHIRNKQLGFKFRRQHSVGKYVVDFYCPAFNLVVEIDGRVHGEETVFKKDVIRQNFLENMGLAIKRYTACQVNDELEWVLGDIKATCETLSGFKQRQPHPASPWKGEVATN